MTDTRSSSGTVDPRVKELSDSIRKSIVTQRGNERFAVITLLVGEKELNSFADALLGIAQGQSDCGVTDAMCEAAVKADTVDRIQGFTYKTHHVIRDVWKSAGEQKIWEIDKNDADAEDKFLHQCRVERMRKVLEAACSVSSTEGK